MCSLCSEGEVGDEYYVLLICRSEEVIRLGDEYIARYYRENSSMFKFSLLMQSSNIKVLRNLYLFVATILRMFR